MEELGCHDTVSLSCQAAGVHTAAGAEPAGATTHFTHNTITLFTQDNAIHILFICKSGKKENTRAISFDQYQVTHTLTIHNTGKKELDER